jgi:hypothetical protein
MISPNLDSRSSSEDMWPPTVLNRPFRCHFGQHGQRLLPVLFYLESVLCFRRLSLEVVWRPYRFLRRNFLHFCLSFWVTRVRYPREATSGFGDYDSRRTPALGRSGAQHF